MQATQYTGRRHFIKQSALAVGALALPAALAASQHKQAPKLAFSTLGCPKWKLPEIVKFAAQNNYQGVEIRVIGGDLDLPKCADFNAANIESTKRMFSENNLVITDLGSSASMHYADAAKRKEHMDDAKRYIDLAEKTGCRFIRVFPNNLPGDDSRPATLNLITKGLNTLAAYAKGNKVIILLETHGDLIKTDELVFVMQHADENGTGLVWDFWNMWSVTKEPVAAVFDKLKTYIKHVHVKDGRAVNGKEQYVLLGRGEAPVKDVVQLLYKTNYEGYYSFEWEKMWHPEIEEPEVALAHYPKEITRYFN